MAEPVPFPALALTREALKALSDTTSDIRRIVQGVRLALLARQVEMSHG